MLTVPCPVPHVGKPGQQGLTPDGRPTVAEEAPCYGRPVASGASKLGRVALALFLAGVVLAAGEWIAGFVDGQAAFRGMHRLRPDAPWLYDLSPGAVAPGPFGKVEYRIASHGFRDLERNEKKPPGTYRVAVLGDSVTFGYGVSREDGFVARTEAALAALSASEHDEKKVEVLNFGISGFNPYSETELFRGVVRDYAPDLTLVQFCVNDLNDPRFHFGASTVQRLGAMPAKAFPNPARAEDAPWEVSPAAALCDHSNLCRVLLGGALGPNRDPVDGGDIQEAFEVRDGPGFEEEWAWLRERYRELAASAAEAGSEFGIIAFPHAAELSSDPAALTAAGKLVTLGREEGWLVIDVLPAMRSSGAEPTALYLDVWHPTSEGHRVASEVIADALREQLQKPAANGREP